MIRPMSPMQKLVAYTSLLIVLAWTAWGLFAIWVMFVQPHH